MSPFDGKATTLIDVEPGVKVLRQSFNAPVPGIADAMIWINCFVVQMEDGGLAVCEGVGRAGWPLEVHELNGIVQG